MTAEHVDVLVVGAGISGVGAGYRLQTECPGRSYAILEGRSELGGTWSLFTYPGVRSDSDMFTLGYPFRPWTGAKSIAEGPSILQYVKDTAAAYGIDRKIRFDHRVTGASWSSDTSTWTVDVLVGAAAEPLRLTCQFLYLCAGYYSYEAGYTPDFPGIERFEGPIVHPQFWPDDLDHRDKQVVVIGSGATAVSLVPAVAETAAKVTMLQRSPSYIASVSVEDKLAAALRRRLPEALAARLIRWKNVLLTSAFYQLCRRRPEAAKKMLRGGVARLLPEGFAIDPHFTPTYDPWDQRMCLVPEGDIFTAIGSGRADIVTDTIDHFTEHGIALTSGAELDADIVVTATGLTMQPCGGVQLVVDGEPVDLGKSLTYRGFMLTGVPNAAYAVGYTNASWTLRVDLSTLAVCKLLNRMEAQGTTKVVPTPDGATIAADPVFNLTSGYVQRGAAVMPKQGTKAPWTVRQNYILDFLSHKFGKLDAHLTFSKGREGSGPDQVAPDEVPVGARE